MQNGLQMKGGVHILGENCPRSNPDVAHMGQYLGPNINIHILQNVPLTYFYLWC